MLPPVRLLVRRFLLIDGADLTSGLSQPIEPDPWSWCYRRPR